MRDTPLHFITRQFNHDADLITRADGDRTNSHGRWRRGDLSTRPIKVSHDPNTGVARDATESAVRRDGDATFYTSADVMPIRIGVDGTGETGDLIRFRGLFYQVTNVHDWDKFVEIEAKLIDPQPNMTNA